MMESVWKLFRPLLAADDNLKLRTVTNTGRVEQSSSPC